MSHADSGSVVHDETGGSNVMPDFMAMLEAAAAETQAIIDNVRPEQLELPTPCTAWTVRDVINHLIQGSDETVEILESGVGSAPRPLAADCTGNDPAGAYAAATARMIATFKAPGILAKMLRLPYGEVPAAAFAGNRAGDLLIHGRDIAQATGQPTDFAPDLFEVALVMAKSAMAGRSRDGSPFKPERPIAADAPAADRLAAFLGYEV